MGVGVDLDLVEDRGLGGGLGGGWRGGGAAEGGIDFVANLRVVISEDMASGEKFLGLLFDEVPLGVVEVGGRGEGGEGGVVEFLLESLLLLGVFVLDLEQGDIGEPVGLVP